MMHSWPTLGPYHHPPCACFFVVRPRKIVWVRSLAVRLGIARGIPPAPARAVTVWLRFPVLTFILPSCHKHPGL
jgi:hypothetical protein